MSHRLAAWILQLRAESHALLAECEERLEECDRLLRERGL